MMSIRPLEDRDLPKVKEIHSRYFDGEFSFPDFSKNSLCKFVIEDDDGQIKCATGVRIIAEMISVTDQAITAREKRDILLQALNASAYMANKNGFNQLHAFVQGYTWNDILKKVGFRDCKGNALVIDCR
jgi:hypothetical protein